MPRRTVLLIFALMVLTSCTAHNPVSPAQLPQLRVTEIDVVIARDAHAPSGTASLVADQARQAAASYSASMPATASTQRMVITVDGAVLAGVGSKIMFGAVSAIRARVDLYESGRHIRSANLRYHNEDTYEGLSGSYGERLNQWHGKQSNLNRLARGIALKALNFAYNQKYTPAFVIQAIGGSDMQPRVTAGTRGKQNTSSRVGTGAQISTRPPTVLKTN